ncbi:MAG TPA: hypothetical protein VMX36_11145 [Sedimentisphaerales bacterium]|nr:hypothetical protein [Sedimentisphaerales bacterium]
MILVDYPGHIIAGMLLIVFAVLIFFAFRCGELRKATRQSYRWPLIVLQYVAIVILLLILWNPSRPKVSEELSRNSVLAFFDTSESMSVVEEGRVNRLDRALNIFQKKFRPLDAGSPAYKVFGFDRQAYHSGSSNFLRRWGSETDMHSLLSVLGKYDLAEEPRFVENVQNSDTETSGDFDTDGPVKESKVIGAVIFTDGQADDKNVHTYLPLNNKDFQIALIGVGSRDRHTDIAIKSINAPSRIAIDTACAIQVVVSAKNFQNQPVTIELLKDNYVVDSKQIPAEVFTRSQRRSDSLAKDVTTEFTIGADRIGSYSFSVRAKTVVQEVNLANNVRSMMIDVVEETRLKVLFYSQVANFDIGKLRQALARDEKIELDLGLDVIRVPALAENLSKTYGYVGLPEEKGGFNKYDVIILGPCELDALTDAQIFGLYSFVVDRGGGLILLPGKAEFGPAEWTNKKVKSLIPVIFDAGNPTIWPSSPGQIDLTLEAVDGKLLDKGSLQDIDGPASPYYRVINPKPASTTLASIKETPIISVHRVGRGRVCLLNISRLFSLYREDLQGGWLYKMMAGLNAQMGRVTAREAGIELFAERAAGQTDKIKFEAYVCDNSFAPVAGANVLLSIRDKVLSMNQVERGYYVVEVAGIHGQAIIATAQAELHGVFLGEKTVAVNLPPAKSEMTNVELDEKFLRELAGKLDGKYFYADDVGDDIEQMFEARTRVGSSRRMTSAWPGWPLLFVLCIILGVSWFLRRAIGLV